MNDFLDDDRAQAETCLKWYFELIKKGSVQFPRVQRWRFINYRVCLYTLDTNNLKISTCEVNVFRLMPVIVATCKDWKKVSFPVSGHSTLLAVELAALDLQDVCPSADCERNSMNTFDGLLTHVAFSHLSRVANTNNLSPPIICATRMPLFLGRFLAEFYVRSALKSAISLL